MDDRHPQSHKPGAPSEGERRALDADAESHKPDKVVKNPPNQKPGLRNDRGRAAEAASRSRGQRRSDQG